MTDEHGRPQQRQKQNNVELMGPKTKHKHGQQKHSHDSWTTTPCVIHDSMTC